MASNRKKQMLISAMTAEYQKNKDKMPDREYIDLFDWELDFEQNEDWVLWEMEMMDFQRGKY
jgi:hypothetical protein